MVRNKQLRPRHRPLRRRRTRCRRPGLASLLRPLADRSPGGRRNPCKRCSITALRTRSLLVVFASESLVHGFRSLPYLVRSVDELVVALHF
ncbi:hypothetical protein GFS60_07116 (plasmid) [Rhodococcus sp. WAY2]|nr:hypothetical protein GFS60_07116 [Rhodococcus sp. WAY2]